MGKEGNLLGKTTTTFQPDEWAYLTTRFRVTSDQAGDSALSIPAEQLLDASRCAAYIAELQRLEQTNSALPATSAFSKRYAAMLTQSGLYAMSMLNKGIDLSIQNCYIASNGGRDARLLNIRYGHLELTVAPEEQREGWRDAVLHSLFASHLTPLWKRLAFEAKIPMAILWENTAIYIFVLYEQIIAAAASQTQLQRCQDDFHYIMEVSGGELFGLRKNPLTTYYHSVIIPSAESHPVRLRKTCCYYYEIDNVRGYCRSCPKQQSK